MTATIAPDALEAYEITAPVYDAFTAHHDYEAWTRTIETLARRHGLPPAGRMLDVGCGTGKSFLPWLARGWSVVGCDRSPAMLERAREKAPPEVDLLVADARDMAVVGSFDLVLVLDDVVNYVAADDHPALFDGLAANLAPGGLLVFDLNTLRTFRSFFAATTVSETEGCVVVWRGGTPVDLPPDGAADAVLDAFVRADDGLWRRSRAHHREHHHPLAAVERALAAAGLDLAGAYGQDEHGDAEPGVDELRHTKAIVVARRRRNDPQRPPTRTVGECASR